MSHVQRRITNEIIVFGLAAARLKIRLTAAHVR
jgi:hypothetical protein